ncbi:MAG: hypothetical protein RL758_746 [Pseudomonadota bacterium]
MTITQEFNKQAGKAITDYVSSQRKALQELAQKASTREEKAQAEQAIKEVNIQERSLNILVSAFTGMTESIVTKEALSKAAEQMRDLMIEDSKKSAGVVDSAGKVLSNIGGPSEGIKGDGYKIGGTRVDLDLLCGPSNERCKTVTDQSGEKVLDLNTKISWITQVKPPDSIKAPIVQSVIRIDSNTAPKNPTATGVTK